MSWPTRTWTQNGWVDFATPGRGDPTGFPDDWRNYESSVENSNYWDIINNPLYEAAANASGIDWDRWVADSSAQLGDEDDHEMPSGDRDDDEGSTSALPGLGGLAGTPWSNIGRDDPDPWFGGPGGENYSPYDPDDFSWGFDRNEFGSIATDLDKMQEWLVKTIKTHSLQDMPIVNRGPEGSDYGIDGDIWVHYGLDQAPQAPKTMDVNYNFNLAELKPNTLAHYTTPEGYPVLDTSTESIAYEDTHYAQWTAQNEADAIAQENAPPTSYGEPVIPEGESAGSRRVGESDLGPTQQTKQRWTENVMKIIGSDDIANVNAWASVAGIKSINSKSDSDQIKAKYREHGGNLPT